jgi:glycosyltransferase involved in cell wall biosynthesis
MENGVVNMVSALDSEFEFQIACLERKGRFSERLRNPGIVCELGKRRGFTLATAMRLGGVILRFRPDVVHTHNLGPLIYSSLATLGGRLSPIVQGEHAQLSEEDCKPRRIRQRRWLYRCCRKIHTVSLAQREELVARGFANICAVVNGVDTDRFRPGVKSQAKIALGIPEDSAVLGIVGRFGPFKRHSALLAAFDILSLSQPHLHLLIVGGGGPEENKVRAQAGLLSAKKRIHFAGFQIDPVGFYQAMDCLVVPSVNEGLSNAVLESMACEVPVLAHLACGNQEVIATGREGVVTDLGSEAFLAEAIGDMLSQDLGQMGKNARQKCLDKFSLPAMARGYSELYRSLMSQPK